MLSQRSKRVRPAPANTVDEQRILDAAYRLLLGVGMRRMTMADISRRSGVSRATLYRRWPNVRAVIAALMTREWSAVAAASFEVVDEPGATVPASDERRKVPAGPDGAARRRLVEGVVAAVRRIRGHPLLRKIIDVDPEFLLPYLLHRRGSSTELQLMAIEHGVRAGHADGSIRDGDPAWQARALLLTAMSFTLTGPIMAEPGEGDRLDEELRQLLNRYVAP